MVHALPRDRAHADPDGARAAGDPADPSDALRRAAAAPEPVIVGFVVGKAVGNSVVRHRVVRQLRAAVAPRLNQLDDAYSAVVVRALPSAAGRPTAELAGDLDAALRRVRSSGRRRSVTSEPATRGATTTASTA